MSVAELEAEVLDVATALGVVRGGGLSDGFFEDPLKSLRTILSDPGQRAALLAALDGLLAADGSISEPTGSLTRHPLVESAIGMLAISILRSGSADDPTVVVGLYGQAAADGYRVAVDIPLVRGDDSGVTLVAATDGQPVSVTATVPVDWDRATEPIGLESVALSALLVAPLNHSRIALTLTGLDLGAGPSDLVLDPAAVESELAHVLVALLRAGLAQAGSDPSVQALLDHLPTVLGVDGELPELPLGELASDAGALRAWLGSLIGATVDARPALLHWLDQLGQLLGAPALAATLTELPGEADPVVIELVAPGASGFGIDLECYLQTPAASTTPDLHLWIRGGIAGELAATRAEAELLVVPLGGNTATRTLTLAQVVAESNGALWPQTPTQNPDFAVGVARGGLRWDGTHVIPVLELEGVRLSDPALVPNPITFDVLDLSNAKTIAAEAQQTVDQVLSSLIGSSGVAAAVLAILGLDGGADALGQFANDPLRAIGAFHRAQLDAGTYRAVAEQIVALFGLTDPLTGTGTAADPWFSPLAGGPVPGGSTITLGVAIWDVASGGDHEVHLGLRLASPGAVRPGWSIALDVDLVRFALPATGAARAGLLGAVDLGITIEPPAAAGGLVSADRLTAAASWAPGAPLRLDATIAGVTVTVDGAPVALGDIALPDGLTEELINSGRDAVRALLDRVAADWGGTAGAVVSALFGLGAQVGGLPSSWPALTPPAGGIAALLSDPLALVRGRLAALVQAAVDDDGQPPMMAALELIAGLIGGRLPTIAQSGVPPIPQGPAITGNGTAEHPFLLPLTDANTPLVAEPIELAVWFEPGPPLGWMQATQELLAGDSTLVANVLSDLGGAVPAVADALTGTGHDTVADWLAAAAGAIDGTDGVVATDVSGAVPPGAALGDPVTAAHHLAPANADAVAAVAAHFQSHAPGLPVVLLAPTFAPDDVWAPVLTALAPPGGSATVDLRVPGVSPDVVDLGGVTAAGAYVVQLADDGTATLDALAARLDRVIGRILTLTGAARVALVGHSAAGLIAIHYAATAATAARTAALATIAAPLVAVLPPDDETAAGVRLVRALAPGGLTSIAPALDAALQHLTTALDGCVGGAPSPYPLATLTRALPAGTDLSAVPSLIVPAQLESPVADAVAAVLGAALQTATAAAPVPTHVCWGVRAQLELGTTAAAPTGPQVDAHVRLDLGRVALSAGAPEPATPARQLTLSATVTDPSGWLLGSAGTGAPLELRLRAAEVEFTAVPGARTSFDVTLYDAAVRGIGGPRLTLGDAQSSELLGGLATALAGAAAGTPANALLQALTQLGLATTSTGAASFYADAVAAVHADPATFLAGRVVPALRALAPQLGLTPDSPTASGPETWRYRLGALPLQLVISAGPAAVGIATPTPLEVAGTSLSLQATLALQNATPDLRATLDIAGIGVIYDNGTLQVAAPPVLAPLTVLPPPAGAALQDAFLAALARTGIAAAVSAALSDALGGSVTIGSPAGLFGDPAGWLAQAGRLGATGGGLDATRVNALLHAIADALDIPVASDGSITVTPGLSLATTVGASAGDLTLSLGATSIDLGGGFALALALAIDVALDGSGAAAGRTVTPSGDAALTVPLPGSWQSITIAAGESATGFTLTVTPHGMPAVQLLPTFSGLWDLIGGNVEALLPGALNALVTQLSAGAPSPVLEQTLALADALGLRTGTPPAFDSGQMATLVDGITHGSLVVDLGKLAAVLQALLPGGAPVTVNVTGSGSQTVLTVGVQQLPVPGTATLAAAIPTSAGPPTIGIAFAGVVLGPVTFDLTLADDAGVLAANSTIAVTLPDAVADAIGFAFAPSLTIAAAPLTITLAPLGTGDPLVVELAPTPGVQRADLGALLTEWAVPIAARIALVVAGTQLDNELWAGGATAHALLRGAGIIDDTGSGVVVHRPLPEPPQLLQGLVGALGALRIPVSSGLGVGLYSEDGRVGIGASGTIDIPVGDYVLTPTLGYPDAATWVDPAPGLGVLLLGTNPIALDAGVRLGGVGIKLARSGGPLVDTSLITIGAVTALAQASVDFSPWTVKLQGGAVVEQLALPLGGSTSTSNPVADSLLSPSGTPGDDKPANPPAKLEVLTDDSGLNVRINDKDGDVPFYVDVQRSFGPLHIDRIGLDHKRPTPGGDLIGALVDGGVSIAGLTVEVQGLELDVPLHSPAHLDQWQVDLTGLAVSLDEGPVVIEGGLLKRIPSGGGVEYDGELTVQVGAWGLTALGAYSRSSGLDGFTSLFAFVVIDAPIGGPPYLFITGLAGGAGYNRQLIVPSDPAQVPTFPLVQAMDAVNTSGDPLEPLVLMSAAMPARRGSYWVAAGIKFTTFELLQTHALAYVALDRGFQIGLIGLMDMALPTPSTAIVSVELALAASYSSADELLAIRAQLTNNSWLISKDCQLTGGFAFYAWFGDHSQVLLSIGGYGPHWIKTPGDPHANQYPDVPPVGFHWAVGDGIVVKGETYFALTPHQLAFGGRLEASYDVDPIRIWFTVYVDVDFQWDPLQYVLDAGVSIGAAFHFTIDLLFGSITVNVSVSLSATIEIQGPPLHGTVTVDLDIASVTVHFGAQPAAAPYLDWPTFAGKYLATVTDHSTGPGDGTSVATITYGQLADSTKGAAGSTAGDQSKPYGTANNPWPVRPEFGIAIASKAPLRSAQFQSTSVPSAAFTGTFDVAPMGSSATAFAATMGVVVETLAGATVDTGDAEVSAQYAGFPLSVWATSTPPQLTDNQIAVNSAPTMTQAMSGIAVAFPVTIAPATAPPDIPVSTLVEDDLPKRPLPFTTAATAPASFTGVAPAVGALATLQHAPSAAKPPRPSLRAVLPVLPGPAAPATVATRAHGTDHHARLRALTKTARAGRGYLPAGAESHVWALGDAAVVRGRGGDPVRVTALSPVGRVLIDHVAPAGELELELAEEATKLVVSAAHDGPTGWTGRSQVHQVGPGTALGAGCTLLLPEPVTHAGRPIERVVRASVLTAGLDPVRTVLSKSPGTIVVVLDTRGTGATGEPTIDGDIEPVAEVRHGTRRYVVCRAHPRVAQPAIEVAGEPAWRPTGVIGLRGGPSDWAARLRRDPAALPAPVSTSPQRGSATTDAAYRINRLRRRSR